jgi:hypothetical protein
MESSNLPSGAELPFHLLDLLVDGPSSYAALHGALVRYYNYPADLDVSHVIGILSMMELDELMRSVQFQEDGTVHNPTTEDRLRAIAAYRPWLAEAPFEDLSNDKIGLWYELTDLGRKKWQQWDVGHEDVR